MLILRREQIEALARPMLEKFVRKAVAHVETYFPGPYGTLGDEEVTRAVRRAISRAGGYGLETERDLLRYVTLVFVFGARFDALPWAAAILEGEADGGIKTGRLQVEALKRRDEGKGYVAGSYG